MNDKTTSSKETMSLNWAVIMGLKQTGDLDWNMVRAEQLAEVKRFAIARLTFSLIGIAILVFSLKSTHGGTMLYGWAGVSALVFIGVAFPHFKDRDWAAQIASAKDLHKETFVSLMVGACWAMVPTLFYKSASPIDMVIIWTVITVMMAGMAVAMSSVPLATTIFLLTTGSGLAVMMYAKAMPILAATAIGYALALAYSCYTNGRGFIQRRSVENALAEKDEVVSLLLREFEDSGGDWIWQTDASKCLTHVSPRFAYALGLQPENLEAKPILEILAGDTWEAGNFSSGLRELADKLKNRDSFSDLIVPVKVCGESHYWELSASPKFDEAGRFQGFRGVGSDVTEQHRSADKINKMARFDTLTGLPNRLQVTEALSFAMHESDRWRGRCAFMMIDLDRFKAVNDTLGHPVGDRLLTRVADRLKSIMSDNEVCGRLGGDEFAVVVKDANDHNRVSRVANQIIETLSAPYEIDQHTLYIGASVGVAFGPRDGRVPETLIRSADLALYRSKDSGRGQATMYEPQLHVYAEERRVVEIALRKALERNEFELHYQPAVSTESGRVESFEALLRWTNPDLGSVSPAKFIPVAEDARLIGPIGEWVLRTACMEAVGWPSVIRVAVNVSAEQLSDSNFVSTVVSALSQSGLPPHRLELEVTESVFMKEGTTAVRVLDQILALGVRLALDDFGTGYSSLGYLSKTKFSTIKVDRSFVQGAAKNMPESIAIIRAVVALANSLGMSTTAEGVETEAECQMISDLGCGKIQGFLFGRPMPAKNVRALFDQNQTQASAA
jgi:diguanylate cyclase (GGDEF)-like protein